MGLENELCASIQIFVPLKEQLGTCQTGRRRGSPFPEQPRCCPGALWSRSACPQALVTLWPAAPPPASTGVLRAAFSMKYFPLVTRVFSAICFKSYGWAHRHSGVFVLFCFLFRVHECQKQLLMRPNVSDDRNIQVNPTQVIVM